MPKEIVSCKQNTPTRGITGIVISHWALV